MTSTFRLTIVPLKPLFPAPVANAILRHGKVYAAVPCAQRWAGFSKGWTTRGLDSAVGQ